MKILAERLKAMRAEKGISCMALGKAIGVSDVSVNRWENNIYGVKDEDIAKLAKYFGVTADYLLGLED